MYSQDVAILWQFQSSDNFSSAAKTVRLYLYELPRRLDNRVSSSSALSEARRIFLRYLHCINVGYCNFMRVLSLNWNYGMCSARYKSLPAVYTTRLARPITGAAHTVIPIQRQHAHKIAISVHLTIYQCTRDRYRRKMRLASENAVEEETRLSRRRGSS